jgi:hypothetical protein
VTLLARIGYSLELIGSTSPASVGSAASYTFIARGGLSPYRLSVVSEDLPAEWTYADNGDGTLTVQSADPQTAGAYSFTIRVVDANRMAVDTPFSLTVAPAALTLSGTLDAGEIGLAYSDSLTRTGGIAPYTYSVASGTLPDGLSLNTSTGIISGTPTVEATFAFVIRVTDGDGSTADSSQSVEITAATDPYFASVVALLHLDGVDGSTTITDVTGKTWSAQGAAQIDTAQSKFGGASGLFDGGDDFVQQLGSTDFDYGTGAFTIEFFIRFAATTRQYVYDAVFLNESAIIIRPSTGVVEVYGPSSHVINSGATPFSTGIWYHIALVRNGNAWTVYRDGVSYVTATDSRSWGSTTSAGIRVGGGSAASSVELNGHLDEVRITKGVARYTGNFTPPSAPFPDS